MQMKKKLAIIAITVALLVGTTAPASASICDLESTSFEIWFAKTFIARC